MANYFACFTLQRVLFALILTFCSVFRPVALSFPYLILLLYLPFVPIAKPKTINGCTGYYFKISIAITVIIFLLQIAFQIVMGVLGNQIIPKHEFLEILFRHIGMIKFTSFPDDIPLILLWYLPDVLMLLSTVFIYLALRKLGSGAGQDVEASDIDRKQLVEQQNEDEGITPERFALLKNLGVFVAMITLLLAATLRPSVPGVVYFIVFLGAATWWACFKELERAFAIICRILLGFLAVHITAFLCYQTPWPQEFFPANSTMIRFLGFSPLFISNYDPPNDDIRIIHYNLDVQIDSYLNPLAILLCYYTLAIVSGFILNKQQINEKRSCTFGQFENGTQHISQQVSLRMKKKPIIRKKLAKDSWHGAADKVRFLELLKKRFHKRRTELALTNEQEPNDEPNERTPLMRRSMRKLNTFKHFQKRSVDGTDSGEIPMEELTRDEIPFTEEEMKPTIFEQLWYGLGQFGDFLFKNSYILTNIIMMAWSIVYHSWITFTYLLWANLLWIIPNQRKNMLRCSPFVVFYAEFLLLAQYLYGMDLTEDELPSTVDMQGINMAQIGFVRYENYPCGPLLLKTLFTMAFWVTLRQMSYESKLQRQSSTLAHLAAPFQVTVSAATTDLGARVDDKKSKFLMKAGKFVKSMLLHLWIWIVILALFLCAIYGKRMTAFRITYMALFLIFLITFQLSWRIWRKTMYVFWLVVIGFAMLTLIMIYTYQFDRFNEYWANYTGIPEDLQKDLGLEKYQTKDLFLHLASPTLVVIITVVQLQIFHKKYLEMLNLPLGHRRENSESGMNPPSSTIHENLDPDSITEAQTEAHTELPTKSRSFKISSVRRMSSKKVVEFASGFYDKFIAFIEYILLFLEIHLIKVILIVGFYVAIQEISAMHTVLAILATLAAASRTYLQSLISRIISLVIAVFLILKMIYQIQYIDHSTYDSKCDDINNGSSNSTPGTIINDPDKNDASWFGFNKITGGETLATLLQGYIGYILITTINTIILLRQKRERYLQGRPMVRPQILFPGITRKLADKDVLTMFKYLVNYLFYKFGIEITLIAVVALIGIRMDSIALLYSFWLCALFAVPRIRQERLWPFFKWFIFTFIIYQYLVVVNLPPFLCENNLWNTDILKRLQEWAWLPDSSLRKQSSKLMLDFVVLLFVCRQLLVFKIEHKYEDSFPGGSNISVVKDIENLGKEEIPDKNDFVTLTKNWLDVIKCITLMGSFWFTLAVVFLAGSNRTNIFSIGYLIGSFIFLWQGAEFYLHPIKQILKSWKLLIGYNVFVITMKAILQIPGCIFIQQLESVCWIVQLLGIRCIRKFNGFNGNNSSYLLQNCEVPNEDVGLVWDGICFAFLIMQYRIFQSYYFCHIINESKASTILASRGAELIQGLRKKQMKLQAHREELILRKIKNKMDRIKANQQKLQPSLSQPKTHFEENAPRGAPLARTTSMSSCAGYHTPIEDEVAGEAVSDLPSDLGRASLLTTGQAPSPMSAILTVSLEGYLDPHRLSIGSPPGSEIVVQQHPSSEESYPVFSPPPSGSYEQSTQTQTVLVVPQTSMASNTLQPVPYSRQHRRQSSVNTVSWTDQGDSSSSRVRPSTNLDPSNETEEVEVTVQRQTRHRRQSSVAISWNRLESQSRRFSYTSWTRDGDQDEDERDDGVDVDEISARTGRSRPYSWGPVGEFYHRPSICFSEIDRSLLSHQESVRSGDYYLFEDIDDKVELELFHARASGSVEDDDIIRRTRENKWAVEQELSSQLKKRRKASLPDQREPVFDPRSTMSEPLPLGTLHRSDDEREKDGKDEYTQPDGQQPGTSKEKPSDESSKGDKDDMSKASKESSTESEPSGLDFILTFISGILVSMTLKLYKLSLNYRYVTRILTQEKKALKAQPNFGQNHGLPGSSWAPVPSALRARGDSKRSSVSSAGDSTTQRIDSIRDTDTESTHRIDSIRDTTEGQPAQTRDEGATIAQLLRPNMFSTAKKETSPEKLLPSTTSMVPEIRILAPSLERGLDESSLKSEPKDTLDECSSPKDLSELEDDFLLQRHSILTELFKSIWFAIISNTDLVCYLMVFVNMVASASILALPMPIMVFLWGTLTVPRPSKTFWVTLIAYTQVVVLIKCFCQFEILWWNSDAITPNQPLAAARIIGVERKPSYAQYDLILLLVIFCHRFMQKQMGIWRTTSDDEEDLNGLYVARKDEPKKELGVQSAVVKQGELTLTLTKIDPDELLKRPDDIDDDDEIVNVTRFPDRDRLFPGIAVLSTKKYCSSCTMFFKKLLKTSNRVTADCYTSIFLCDFINFFVLLFGFTAFGSSQGDGGVTSYLEENKIPVAFLIMLLLQFVFIIVDRALYLRKNLVGKVIFQFITVIVMHIWLFFLVPVFSERSFNTKIPPVLYYFVKCFYFLLSAYQIRCGYPKRILGNCLTKGFSVFNLGAFKVYMLTPFLFELRALMDWIWTDSSMPLFEWLKMEDIFANIYEMKCMRQLESDLPAPRGMAKGSLVKYIMGGGFLFAIIALVWGPLALFALGNTVGEPNNPYEVTVELKIGPYEPVYRMSAQSSQIYQFNEAQWTTLQRQYTKDRVALTFLSNYESNDVAAVVLGPNSTALWIISPPDLERLKQDLKNNVTLKVRYKYSVTRITYNEKMAPTITDEPSYDLEPDDPVRSGLVAMLDGTSNQDRVELPHLFPKFLKVKNLGDLKAIPQLLLGTSEYRNISLQMHSSPNNGVDMFWEVLEVCTDKFYKDILGNIPYASCVSNLVLYTFSDKLFPATLSWLTAGGVMGIYSTFVFLASRFIRGLFSGGSQNIMFSELPYVDRILQLCLDIYLVRESMEFALEEDLFAKLIFLYRSPETMIKWTRPAEEQSDDDESSDEDNDDTHNDKSIKHALSPKKKQP